jgi:hypothetical protein
MNFDPVRFVFSVVYGGTGRLIAFSLFSEDPEAAQFCRILRENLHLPDRALVAKGGSSITFSLPREDRSLYLLLDRHYARGIGELLAIDRQNTCLGVCRDPYYRRDRLGESVYVHHLRESPCRRKVIDLVPA